MSNKWMNAFGVLVGITGILGFGLEIWDKFSETPGQDVEFWDGFLDIADPETADIGRSLGQERLRQYAANVCSTLEQGGRMQDVPSIATGNILTTPEFELTLQEASISTYCPAQIDKLE